MGTLDDRKEQFRQRTRHNKIESILRMMRSTGITIEDLQGHIPEKSKEQKLKERREIERAKQKARDSLVKAREAKRIKQEGINGK